MTLINRLEKSLGWMAIGHLPLYIVAAQGLVYIWCLLNPGEIHHFIFDRIAILYGGEYWRLLTSLFLIGNVSPSVLGVLFSVFFLYLLYIYGTALETEWGSFAFTLFYLVGVIGTYIAGFVFDSPGGVFYLNTTIFLAFAALHPDFELFLIVFPVKVKWLAWFTWGMLALRLISASNATRGAILVSIANYFLFFGNLHWNQAVEKIRSIRHREKFKSWNR